MNTWAWSWGVLIIDFTNCQFIYFLGKGQCNQEKAVENCTHVDVAIKSYVISILTGSTFDGFIDCTNMYQTKRVDLCTWMDFYSVNTWYGKKVPKYSPSQTENLMYEFFCISMPVSKSCELSLDVGFHSSM